MKRLNFPDTNDEEYKRSRFLPCALRFLYIDDDTLRRLQSLEFTSYEGFPLHLDCYTVHGDRAKQVYWINVRLEDWEQDQKFRNALAEEYGRMVVPAHSKSSDSGVCACHERETGVYLFAIQRLGRRVFREYPESDLGSYC